MRSKSFISTVFLMSFGFVLVPFFGSRANALQTAAATENTQDQSRVGTEMMSHQHLMEDLLVILQKEFQAVVDSKDASGFVRDKTAVKAYKSDLDGLLYAVRHHRLFAVDYERWCGQSFATDYEHWCGPDKKQNAMSEHQQRMKVILHDLSNTFDIYVTADDHSMKAGPNKTDDALEAHRDALVGFANAVRDHDQEMARMMTHASAHGSS